MKIVHLRVPDHMSEEWEETFRVLRASGIEPVAVQDTAELEYCLGRSEYGASLHIVGVDDGAPGAVAERALRFPDKLVIVAGSVRGIAKQFISVLRQSEAELLVVLDDFENVAEQIRYRLPLWFTRRWVLTVLRPVIASRLALTDTKDQALLDWLLLECPVVHAQAGARRLGKPEMKRLNALLARAGLRTTFEIQGSVQLFLYWACIYFVGSAPREAAKMCGLSDTRLIEERAAKVLGDGDLRALHRPSSEVLSAATLSYICRAKDAGVRGTPVPAMAPALQTWLESVWVSVGSAPLIIEAEPETHEPGGFASALVESLDPFLNAHLSAQLKHPQRVEDAKQRVWQRVWQRIQLGQITDIPLTVDGIATHKGEWKKLLASLCQSEIWITRRGVDRRENLRLELEKPGPNLSRWYPAVKAADEDTYSEELIAAVHAAVVALPADQRAVVELRHFSDLTTREIHQTLGWPEADIRGLLAQGEEELKAALGGIWEDWWGGMGG